MKSNMKSCTNMIFIKKYIHPRRLEVNISKKKIDEHILQLLLQSRTYNSCGYNKSNDEFWGKIVVNCVCIYYFTIKVVHVLDCVSSVEFRTYIHNKNIHTNILSFIPENILQ